MIYAQIDIFVTFTRIGDKLIREKQDSISDKSEFSIEEFELSKKKENEGKILNLFGNSKKIEELEDQFTDFLKKKMNFTDEEISTRSAIGKKFVAHEFTILTFLGENDFTPVSEKFFYKS